MLPKSKLCYRSFIVLYLQISMILTAPVQMKLQPKVTITEAQPQVMMHTLQQPIPIETFHALKTQPLHHLKPAESQDIPTPSSHLVKTKPMHQTLSTEKQGLPMMIPLMYPLNTESLIQLMQMGAHQSTNYPSKIDPYHQMVPIDPQQLPVPMMYQQSNEEMQQMSMQQQMLALQELQMMQKLNTIHSPLSMTMPQPVLILLPDERTDNTDSNDLFKNTNEDSSKENEYKYDEEYNNEDLDSVIVGGPNKVRKGTRKAILLIPNAKFSIGGFISTIPWLPIEVNVPDTVTWAWNGISSGIASIISIIGSRLPFRPSPPANTEEANVKMFLKRMQMNNYDYEPVMPMFVMPLDRMIPVHFK